MLLKCLDYDCQYVDTPHSHDIVGDDVVDLSLAQQFMAMNVRQEEQEVGQCHCDVTDSSSEEEGELRVTGSEHNPNDTSSESDDSDTELTHRVTAYLTGMWRTYMMVFTHYWAIVLDPEDDIHRLVYDPEQGMQPYGRILPIKVCSRSRDCPDWNGFTIHGHQGSAAPQVQMEAAPRAKQMALNWLHYRTWEHKKKQHCMVQGQVAPKNY